MVQIVDNSILRFSDLSFYQREVRKNKNIDWTEALIRCNNGDCGNVLKAKLKGKNWDLGGWKTYLERAYVQRYDFGYCIKAEVEFFCPDCQKSKS